MQEMCAGEPYSVLRLGDEETAGRITNQSLYVHGQALMASSRVEVIYCGSAEAQRVEDAVLTALAALPRGAQTALPEVQRIQAPDTPRRIVETMDVTQGKLAMGYRCSSDDYPAMVLANLIFGGTSNSKLFLNVRERLSLCYYASSSYARSKSILTVSSGVETADFERAETEIGRQLQAVGLSGCAGEFLSGPDRGWGRGDTGGAGRGAGAGDKGAHRGGGTDGEAGYGVLPAGKGGGVTWTRSCIPASARK